MNPLLSVIIVAYKSRDEILSCVNSIPTTLSDRGVARGVEIIVVDNSLNAGGVAVAQLTRGQRADWVLSNLLL